MRYRLVAYRNVIARGLSHFACLSFKSDVTISSIVVSQVQEIRYVIPEIDEIEIYDTVPVYLVYMSQLMLEQCDRNFSFRALKENSP